MVTDAQKPVCVHDDRGDDGHADARLERLVVILQIGKNASVPRRRRRPHGFFPLWTIND
jgi:hypothetical protein